MLNVPSQSYIPFWLRYEWLFWFRAALIFRSSILSPIYVNLKSWLPTQKAIKGCYDDTEMTVKKRRKLGSISTTFYTKILCAKIPKAQKDSQVISVFNKTGNYIRYIKSLHTQRHQSRGPTQLLYVIVNFR